MGKDIHTYSDKTWDVGVSLQSTDSGWLTRGYSGPLGGWVMSFNTLCGPVTQNPIKQNVVMYWLVSGFENKNWWEDLLHIFYVLYREPCIIIRNLPVRVVSIINQSSVSYVWVSWVITVTTIYCYPICLYVTLRSQVSDTRPSYPIITSFGNFLRL